MTTSIYIYAKRSPFIQPSFSHTQTETSVIQSFNIDTNANSICLMMTQEQYVDFLISLDNLVKQEIEKQKDLTHV